MEYHLDANSVSKYQIHLIKKELQDMCLKLGQHGEECLLITANISDKSASYLGSSNGVMFLQTKIFNIIQEFYRFCNEQIKRGNQPVFNRTEGWTNSERMETSLPYKTSVSGRSSSRSTVANTGLSSHVVKNHGRIHINNTTESVGNFSQKLPPCKRLLNKELKTKSSFGRSSKHIHSGPVAQVEPNDTHIESTHNSLSAEGRLPMTVSENYPVSVNPSNYTYLDDLPIDLTQNDCNEISQVSKESRSDKISSSKLDNSVTILETIDDRKIEKTVFSKDNITYQCKKAPVVMDEICIEESGSMFTICSLDDCVDENILPSRESLQETSATVNTTERRRKRKSVSRLSVEVEDDITIISEEDSDNISKKEKESLSLGFARDPVLKDGEKSLCTDEKNKSWIFTDQVSGDDVCVTEMTDNCAFSVLELEDNECVSRTNDLAKKNENEAHDNMKNNNWIIDHHQESESESFTIVENKNLSETEHEFEISTEEEGEALTGNELQIKTEVVTDNEDIMETNISYNSISSKIQNMPQMSQYYDKDSSPVKDHVASAFEMKGDNSVEIYELSTDNMPQMPQYYDNDAFSVTGHVKSATEIMGDNSVGINKFSTEISEDRSEMYITFKNNLGQNEDGNKSVKIRGGNANDKKVNVKKLTKKRKNGIATHHVKKQEYESSEKKNKKRNAVQGKKTKNKTTRKKKIRKKKAKTKIEGTDNKQTSLEDKNTDELFKCEFCGKCFRSQNSVVIHKRFHEVTEHRCPECDVVFKSAIQLNRHRKSEHDKVDKFMCEFCGTQLTTKSSLEIHYRTHTGERPFECEICLRRFITKTTYDQHIMIVHSDTKKYSCELCGKQYKWKHKLKIHTEIIHKGLRPFSCEICGRAFNRRDNLKVHVKSHKN